ncbi:hypothetical protein [Amycolatopsis sp. NPDC003731]
MGFSGSLSREVIKQRDRHLDRPTPFVASTHGTSRIQASFLGAAGVVGLLTLTAAAQAAKVPFCVVTDQRPDRTGP